MLRHCRIPLSAKAEQPLATISVGLLALAFLLLALLVAYILLQSLGVLR